MYFRDPAGNLWELNCPEGFAGPRRRDLPVDVSALRYHTWNDPGVKAA
jgi:hypothetical protein